MICSSCGADFTRVCSNAALERPDLCGSCWIELTEPRHLPRLPQPKAPPMNLKKEIKPRVCAALRCTTETTDADLTEIGGPSAVTDGPTEICGKHFGLAVAEYGIENVRRIAASSALVPAALVGHVVNPHAIPGADVLFGVDPAEPAQLAIEGESALVEVRAFAIAGQADLDLAAELLAEAKARAKYVLTRKEAITKPLNAALKAARDLFRPAEQHFAEIEQVLRAAIAGFHGAQAEHNAAALAAAAEAFVEGDVEAVAAAVSSMASTTNTEGIGIRHTFAFEVTEPDAVERAMCSPDRAKITAYMRDAIVQCREAGLPEEEIAATIAIPGVTFVRNVGVSVKS